MEWIGPALANVFSPLDLLVLVAGVAGGILVGIWVLVNKLRSKEPAGQPE